MKTPLKFHCIRHVQFEGAGVINQWLARNKHSIVISVARDGDRLPTVNDFDVLIILGGPQSACELDKYPYLYQEIELIDKAIAAKKPVLGICLGAQLIGEALGAKTQKSPHKEVGFFPVELTAAGKKDAIFSHFPEKFISLHWHNDMPGINNKMELLAYSAGCPHQAFRCGKNIYGLQFHLEIDLAQARRMVDHAGDSFNKQGQFIQSPEQLLAGDFTAVNQRMWAFLDKFVNNQ